MLTRLWR